MCIYIYIYIERERYAYAMGHRAFADVDAATTSRQVAIASRTASRCGEYIIV